MFDNTKVAFQKTWNDIKKFFYLCNVCTQALYVVYLLYAIFAQKGELWVNVALCAVSTAYFVFFLVITSGERNTKKKKAEKTGARIFKYVKQLIKFFHLGVLIYGIYNATQAVSFLAVLQLAFLMVGWTLGVVFDVIELIVERYKKLFIASFEKDTKPITDTKNFLKKLVGKEVAPPKAPTKEDLLLDKLVEESKAEKAMKKQAEKEEKKRAKLFAKTKKRAPEITPDEPPALEAETAPALIENKRKKKRKNEVR